MIQQDKRLYKRHSLGCKNLFVELQADISFFLVVKCFSNQPTRIKKQQIMAQVMAYPTHMVDSEVSLALFLGETAESAAAMALPPVHFAASLPSATLAYTKHQRWITLISTPSMNMRPAKSERCFLNPRPCEMAC